MISRVFVLSSYRGDIVRTFYIFKINDTFKAVTLSKPYNLFLALDNIHRMDKSELSLAVKLYEELCDKNDVVGMNKALFYLMQERDAYTKFNNYHIINDYFTNESSKLTVNRAYLKLKSSRDEPIFFELLKCYPNLFVIDFARKDYFWLS